MLSLKNIVLTGVRIPVVSAGCSVTDSLWSGYPLTQIDVERLVYGNGFSEKILWERNVGMRCFSRAFSRRYRSRIRMELGRISGLPPEHGRSFTPAKKRHTCIVACPSATGDRCLLRSISTESPWAAARRQRIGHPGILGTSPRASA